MCGYDLKFPVNHCKNPERDSSISTQSEIRVLSPTIWAKRLSELALSEVAILEQAVIDAAEIHADVHVYRSASTPVIGISLEAGTGPNVKIWEH